MLTMFVKEFKRRFVDLITIFMVIFFIKSYQIVSTLNQPLLVVVIKKKWDEPIFLTVGRWPLAQCLVFGS